MNQSAEAANSVEKPVFHLADAANGLLESAHKHFANRVLEHGYKLLMRLEDAARRSNSSVRSVGSIAKLDSVPMGDAYADSYEAKYDSVGEGSEHDATQVHVVFRFESRLGETPLQTRHTVLLFVENLIKDERLELFTYSATGQGVEGKDAAADVGAQQAIDGSLGACLDALNVDDTVKVLVAINAAKAERVAANVARAERAAVAKAVSRPEDRSAQQPA